MEYHFSTSISKVNSFPILPPLITNEITTEIQYYKQLAIAIQERLKFLETIEKDKQELHKNRITMSVENSNSPIDFIFKPENDNIKQNMASIDEIIIKYPTKDKIVRDFIDIHTSVDGKAKSKNFIRKEIVPEINKKKLKIDKVISDDDSKCLIAIPLCSSISNDTISDSTDLNQYFNISASIKTDTTGSIPENWKPQIPKTLDIVPIAVDKVNKKETLDKSNLVNEETPRLVRRGSYILDTPSPMLLALMQNDSTNIETNSSTSSIQSIKCKEWNSDKIKTNWGKKTNFKEPTLFHLNYESKFRNYTNIPYRICRSVSNSKICSPLDVYDPAKSIDCIQAMFIKDFNSPKNINSKSSNQSKINASPVNVINGIRKHNSKKIIKNTSILNLANKLSGSLGSLSNINLKPFKKIETKNSDFNLQKNSNFDSVKSNDSKQDNFFFPMKTKPLVTSEKIITVFKEIQDTHKKQMIELMSRQQKEQIIMQENFKKQQIVLLSQIRKAFPEISISALSEEICGKASKCNSKSLNLKIVNAKSDSKKKEDIKKLQEKDECAIIKSTMNFTNSEELSNSCYLNFQSKTPTVHSIHENNSQPYPNFSDSFLESNIQLPTIRAIDDIPVGSFIHKHSHVSRQLFPNDNKIIHSPILDNLLYTGKHIKAATIINAYAKGFLVRRLMKTEKIITLKNTYQEALHCMLRLHVDEPLQIPEIRFKKRLQQQCDAASINIVDLFSQKPAKQMEIIAHDREIKAARSDRPSSAHSYSFATQRTLARKKFKDIHSSMMSKSCPVRTRCQTLPSNSKEKKTTNSLINQGIKRSTSAGTVRKPWR